MSNVINHPNRKDRFKAFGWINLSAGDIEAGGEKMDAIYEEIERQADFLEKYCPNGEYDDVRAMAYITLLKGAFRFGRPELTDPIVKRFGFNQADREYVFVHRPQVMNEIYGI